MYRRDYIQRMLEEFGKMLAHVKGLKSMNRKEMALDELRNSYKTYFELDETFLHSIHPNEFLGIILSKADLKKQHLEALAQALMTEAEMVQDADPVLARTLREKSLVLYRYLEQTDAVTFSVSRKEAISELLAILGME